MLFVDETISSPMFSPTANELLAEFDCNWSEDCSWIIVLPSSLECWSLTIDDDCCVTSDVAMALLIP
jgi:hypothetical protein